MSSMSFYEQAKKWQCENTGVNLIKKQHKSLCDFGIEVPKINIKYIKDHNTLIKQVIDPNNIDDFSVFKLIFPV